MGNLVWIILALWYFWGDIKPALIEVTTELKKVEKQIVDIEKRVPSNKIKSTPSAPISEPEVFVGTSKFNKDGSVNWDYIDEQEKKKWK